MTRAGPVVEELVKAVHWRVAGSWSFAQASHINLSEQRAPKAQLRALASDPGCHRKGRLLFLDSRVVTGAGAKGRSSTFMLNGIKRSGLAYSIDARVAPVHLWISTGTNPAGFPSRSNSLPPPTDSPLFDSRLIRSFESLPPSLSIVDENAGLLGCATKKVGRDISTTAAERQEGVGIFSTIYLRAGRSATATLSS